MPSKRLVKLLFCALAVVLSACGPQVYRPGEPVALRLDDCISSALGGRIAQDVHGGAHLWDSFGGTFDAAGAAMSIDVRCLAGPVVCVEGVVAGEWDGTVALNTCLWTQPHGDGPLFDGLLSSVVAHELGHAMGLVHESDPLAVMSPSTYSAFPSHTDAQQLCSLYPGVASCALGAGGLWPDPTP